MKDIILHKLHNDAEYISGGLTYVLSMVSLNIHLSTYGSAILVKLPIFLITLVITFFKFKIEPK